MGTLYNVDATTGDIITAGALTTAGAITSTSTTSGFLLPKLTTTQRNAIPTPATGLQIFNTTTNEVEFYNGTSWLPIGTTTPAAGVSGAVQFSNGSGAFLADDTKFHWDDTSFRLGIGTNTPSTFLDITDSSATTNPMVQITQNSSGRAMLRYHSAAGDFESGYIGGSFVVGQTGGGANQIWFPAGGSNLRIDCNSMIINATQGGGTTIGTFGSIASNSADTYFLTGWSGLQVQSAGVLFKPATSPSLSGATNVKVVTNSTTDTLQASQNNLAYAPVAITSIKSVSTTYTVLPTDWTVLSDATGGAFAVTLPSVSQNTGRMITIKKIDSSANAVTVTPASGTIDGAGTYALTTQYQFVVVQSDGTNWWIV